MLAVFCERIKIDFASGQGNIDSELLDKRASEGFALPVVEVAAKYALEYAAEIVAHLVGLQSEYEHEYSKLFGRMVEVARFA